MVTQKTSVKKVLEGIFVNDAATAVKRFFEVGLRAYKKQVSLEKTPHTFLSADKLEQIYPDIRYIHVFRDPRDVFSSVKPLGWGPMKATKFVGWYNNLMEEAYKVKQMVSSRNYLTIKLEDLVRDKHTEVPKIFKFCKLSYQPTYSDIITESNAHIQRYKDLTSSEVNIGGLGCRDIYYKWKEIYEKEKQEFNNDNN